MYTYNVFFCNLNLIYNIYKRNSMRVLISKRKWSTTTQHIKHIVESQNGICANYMELFVSFDVAIVVVVVAVHTIFKLRISLA